MTVPAHELQLRHLRERYQHWIPWLKHALRGDVQISRTGPGEAFVVLASWRSPAGVPQTHRKEYDLSAVKTRVGCLKDHARALIREVLEKRGVI